MQNGHRKKSPITGQLLLFIRNFFRYPAMLGSLIPSSSFLVNDIVAQVNWSRARVIVEYGPGVGTITREVLKRMHPQAVLVAIELNTDFVGYLREEVDDPRLHVVHGSASEVRRFIQQLNLPGADCIISGIPYSVMSDSLRRQVLRESKAVLLPEGALLVYQFTTAVLPYLESHFGSVRQDFQWLNILPARIFYCTP